MAIVYPPALGNIPSPSSLTPTVVTTLFSGVGGVGTHASTDWQISTTNTFTTGTFAYNQNDAVNLTSLTVPAATLSSNITYYMRARHRDSNGDISNWSKTATFNTGLQIATPSVTVSSPTPLIPILAASAFSGVNTHSRSDWDIATDELFANIVETNTDTPSDLTQWSPQTLSFDTLYYVRLRYKDNLGQYSEWSSPTSFYTDTQTNVNPNINRPSITSPANAATGSTLTPTLSGSGFIGANGATHVSSTWQIALTSSFGSSSGQAPGGIGTPSPQISSTSGLVFESANDINNKTSISINPGV